MYSAVSALSSQCTEEQTATSSGSGSTCTGSERTVVTAFRSIDIADAVQSVWAIGSVQTINQVMISIDTTSLDCYSSRKAGSTATTFCYSTACVAGSFSIIIVIRSSTFWFLPHKLVITVIFIEYYSPQLM